MLRLEGDRDLAHAAGALWSKLTDARFLAECIPDVERVAVAEPRRLVCTIRPGLSFVRGSLEVAIEIADAVEGHSARYLTETKGIGSQSTVESTLTFLPQNGTTRVHWTAEIKHLGGLLKAVPQGLIKASANKVVSDVWDAIERKLAEQK